MPIGPESLAAIVSAPGALRTHLRRWWERVYSAPPVLSRQLFLQTLKNQHPAITNELPVEPPLFVLATGRCGTHTLAHLLKLAPGVQAWHEPMPDLFRLARQVYHMPDANREVVAEALLLARGSLWQSANMADKRYAEMANHVTMLAPFLHYMMPAARFLHVTRAPLPFVRSATAFGWYSVARIGGGRLTPRPGARAAADWGSMDSLAKNAWLWQEINRFASDFISTLPPGQGLHLRSEDIFAANLETLHRLFAFVGSGPPSRRRTDRVLGQQLNAGRYRSGARPVQDLTATQRETLQQECRQLALELGYSGVEG